MATENFDLTLRRHERYLGEYPGEVLIAPAFAGSVRIARSSQTNSGGIAVKAVDFSLGGVGLRSPVYLPRGSALTIRLTVPGPVPYVLEAPISVQRVRMLDSVPNYYLGTAFDLVDQGADG
ncbi:MAG: hypothetical protein NTV94_17395, partial [Planctomycetota bacterium]|nr:hypothetical protein [Planctomycetota bacterium]